jgi:hypothetical protein
MSGTLFKFEPSPELGAAVLFQIARSPPSHDVPGWSARWDGRLFGMLMSARDRQRMYKIGP